MGKHTHILSNIDRSTGYADCLKCGKVKFKLKGSAKCPRCVNSIREHRGKGGPTMQPHGLTDVQAAQFKIGKTCEICFSSEKLVVDHCHDTLKIRGVLCGKCNKALGFFEDDANRIKMAAKYIDRHSIKV